jgi:D-sedoheptulose 7-phosphate isomerase
MSERISSLIRKSGETVESAAGSRQLTDSVENAAILCTEAILKGKKIMLAGNGGSAADAQHIAAELVNRFGFERPGIPAIAITTDTSVLTSVANDYNYNRVFARQVEALGQQGDVLIVLSTSGNSASITEAVKAASPIGIRTIALTGRTGGNLNGITDLILKVPSDITAHIQEVHIIIGHILCAEIENSLYKK